MIRLSVLGVLDCRDESGRPFDALLAQPKLCAILAYLTIAGHGTFTRRDTLLALFWPELDSEHARSALSKSVHALRRELGRDAVRSRGDNELAVDATAVWCDAVSMEELLGQGDLAGGLALYRGPLLGGFHIRQTPEFEHWLEQKRARLAELAAQAALRLSDERSGAGDHVRAAEYARRALEIVPLDEGAVQRHMLALDRGGQRVKALQVFDDFTTLLGQTLEVAPSPETRAIADQLRLDAREAPDATRPAVVSDLPSQAPAARSRTQVPRARRAAIGIAVALLLFGGGWIYSGASEVLGLDLRPLSRQSHRERAIELYRLGTEARRRANPEGKREAIRYFRAAIAADSTFAEALAALAVEYAAGGLQGGVPLPQGEPMAETLVRRALALDSTLPGPHIARGVSQFLVQWDWAGAIESFQQALRLDPNAAAAYVYLSQVLAATGRFAEAERAMRRMLELQAVQPSHVTVGLILYHLRRYEEAATQFELGMHADSSYASNFLFGSRPYLLAGKYRDYARVMVAWARLTGRADPQEMERMALGLASPSGRRESLRILARWREAKPPPLSPYDFARLYAHLGMREEALKCLEEAYQRKAPGIYSLAVEPLMDPLRNEPRFQAILDSMNLPKLTAEIR